MYQLEGNLNNYFYLSLKALRLLKFEEAVNLIDLAIIDSPKKEFYMFQKSKILFVASLFPKCARYIEQNIVFFYKHCSLGIFSQILYYYEQSSKVCPTSLSHLLSAKGIPFVLADEYIAIYNKAEVNFLEKATDAMSHNNYAKCISYCDLIFKEGRPPVSAYLLKGEAHQILGEYDLAARSYKKAQTLDPHLISTYHNLGLMAMELKSYAKGILYFQQALNLEPANLECHSLLAEAFYKWKKYDSALFHLKKITTQKPGCFETHLRIANIYTMTNRSRKAKKHYKKALRLQKTEDHPLDNKMPLICSYTD